MGNFTVHLFQPWYYSIYLFKNDYLSITSKDIMLEYLFKCNAVIMLSFTDLNQIKFHLYLPQSWAVQILQYYIAWQLCKR